MGGAFVATVDDFISVLRSGGFDALSEAADALADIGSEAVPALIGRLRDEDSQVRQLVAMALGKIGPAAAEAVPALIDSLRDEVFWVREFAAAALGEIGPVAIPALVGNLRDEDSLAHAGAAWALWWIGPAAAEAVPALIGRLRDEDSQVRQLVAMALGKIGPAAAEAVPALIGSLRDEVLLVCEHAAAALGEIGPIAITAFVDSLRDEDSLARVGATEALSGIGSAAVPALLTAIRNESGLLRRNASKVLMLIDSETAMKVLEPSGLETSRPVGLELMGDNPVKLRKALEWFRRIGEDCRAQHRDRFSLARMGKRLGVDKGTLGNKLNEVSDLFQEYFRDVEGRLVAHDFDEYASTDRKVFERAEKRMPTICEPLGWRAWELACGWLLREGEREAARKQSKRQNS